jgi:hypothetical protein
MGMLDQDTDLGGLLNKAIRSHLSTDRAERWIKLLANKKGVGRKLNLFEPLENGRRNHSCTVLSLPNWKAFRVALDGHETQLALGLELFQGNSIECRQAKAIEFVELCEDAQPDLWIIAPIARFSLPSTHERNLAKLVPCAT